MTVGGSEIVKEKRDWMGGYNTTSINKDFWGVESNSKNILKKLGSREQAK